LLLNFSLWLLASRPLLPYVQEVELGKHAKAFPPWCCCGCLDHTQNLPIHRLAPLQRSLAPTQAAASQLLPLILGDVCMLRIEQGVL